MKCKERKDAGLASGQSQAGPGHRGADATVTLNIHTAVTLNLVGVAQDSVWG